jgi:hypothetical protein
LLHVRKANGFRALPSSSSLEEIRGKEEDIHIAHTIGGDIPSRAGKGYLKPTETTRSGLVAIIRSILSVDSLP